MLDFLRSTGVGGTVPREDGEDEEDQDGASESSGAEDSENAWCSFCVAFAFTVWRVVGRGENPVGLGTLVSTRSV